jgi:hypothetical protein
VRKRLARFAVIQSLLHAALPLCVTLAIAANLDMLNTLVFEHFGYVLNAAPALVSKTLLGIVFVQLAIAGWFAWREWLRAGDLVAAAEHIDRYVGARQEIVTLATLVDPAHPESAKMRSPLFPMLWARAAAYLQSFDPRSAFTLEVRKPLVRSLMLAGLTLLILAPAAFALMVQPTPAQSLDHRLQLLANEIDASASSPARRQLAAAARDVAKDLVNPKLPPKQKIAEITALDKEFRKYQAQRQSNDRGTGNSAGGGKGNGGGADKGSGSGSGSGASSTGSGAGAGAQANQQMAELHNDIAKAQMRLQQEANAGDKTGSAKKDSMQRTGAAPEPHGDANRPGGGNSSNGSGQVSQPQGLASARMPSGQESGARQNNRGSMGDTHLGEFPKAGNYQRFYKLGESGPAISVRDARYVTFQLPSEIESAGGGALVTDSARPRAVTPYTNQPLKHERVAVSPDERQLVPPRYRELIH